MATPTRFNDSRYEVYTKIGPDETPIAVFGNRSELLHGLLRLMPAHPSVSILVKNAVTGFWSYWRDGPDYPTCEFEGSEPALMEFLGMGPGRIRDELPSDPIEY